MEICIGKNRRRQNSGCCKGLKLSWWWGPLGRSVVVVVTHSPLKGLFESFVVVFENGQRLDFRGNEFMGVNIIFLYFFFL